MKFYLAMVAVLGGLSLAALAGQNPTSAPESFPKTITGRVVHDADGSPVASASVRLEQTPRVFTDADGRFVLPNDQDGWRGIWVDAAGLASESRKIDLTGRTRLDGLEFKLHPSYQIRGRVVDEHGKPVTDARVSVGDWPVVQTRSDSDGEFRLDTRMARSPRLIVTEAAGYSAVLVSNPAPETVDIVLQRVQAASLAGKVTDAQGKPVGGVNVYLIPKPSSVRKSSQRAQLQQVDKTGANGAFHFTVAAGAYHLLALSEDLEQQALLRDISVGDREQKMGLQITLQRRGWVDGRVASSQPDQMARKEFAVQSLDFGPAAVWDYRESGVTDDAGHFRIRQLVSGRYSIEVSAPLYGSRPLLSQTIEITEQTHEIAIGGTFSGIVRGQLVGLGGDAAGQVVELLRSDGFRCRSMTVGAEGGYEFVDLPPGDYTVRLFGYTRNQDTLRASAPVKVTDLPGPVVANIDVKRIVRVKPGQSAPDFTVTDLNGQMVRLSALRGKIVFLDFWATTCGPCLAEIPHYKELVQKMGSRDDFVLFSLSLDADEAKWREFITKKQMTWRQALDKDGWNSGVAARYGVTGIPASFLIDRQGRVVKVDLRGRQVAAEIESALGANVGAPAADAGARSP